MNTIFYSTVIEGSGSVLSSALLHLPAKSHLRMELRVVGNNSNSTRRAGEEVLKGRQGKEGQRRKKGLKKERKWEGKGNLPINISAFLLKWKSSLGSRCYP